VSLHVTIFTTVRGVLLAGDWQVIENMVRPERIELPTSWFVAMHSIQLSYGRIVVKLCLRIITETKSFRPTSIARTLRDKTRARFDRAPISRSIPRGLWKSAALPK
jgi:hypothetical protein